MPPGFQNLDIDHLSLQERLDLIGVIWDSISDTVKRNPLTCDQKMEINRRLAAHQANPQAAIPWEQVEAGALARFRKNLGV